MNWQELWAERASFVIFDACHGDGAGFREAVKAWRADPARPGRLHYIALDRQAAMPGLRRVPGHGDAVTLDLLGAPIDAALSQLRAQLDFAWLHGMAGQGSHFARALGRLAAPGMRLRCEGLAPAQQRALEAASFALDGEAGTGRYASRRPFAAGAAERERRALVIGAGLAGSAACQRLIARGWHVTLIERHAHPACEASGNMAGIAMPLLSRDDNLMTRLSRAAFLFAQGYWDALGGIGQGGVIAGERCGVLQLARDGAHADVQRAIAAEQRLPSDFAQWLEPAEASALLGSPAPHGAWRFPRGGWMRPPSACGAMLTACGEALVRRFGAGEVTLARQAGGWAARNRDGTVIAEAPVVILASGARRIEQAAALPLARLRGQVTHLAAGSIAPPPMVLCREAYLTPAVRGWHSTGATYDGDDDPALRASSQDDNLDRMRAMLGDPQAAAAAPLEGRVGFRSVAPDRLPLIGALPDPAAATRLERLREVPRHPGLYGLLGYASRGLTWAPLAAELLAAQLDGTPLPLESDLVDALDPARFLLRERRRNTG